LSYIFALIINSNEVVVINSCRTLHDSQTCLVPGRQAQPSEAGFSLVHINIYYNLIKNLN